MQHHDLISLGSIVVLGIAAQWLAWRLKFPSIILLLSFGLIAGPLTGFIDPDKLFGNGLMPFISIAVAVILFEGGLTLRLKELKSVGKVVLSLITIGVLITGILGAVAAYFLLGLDFKLSILLGSIITVTGPTVIGPLLRHIRPSGRVAEILKWEGIVIDPVGALLAVLVFEAIMIGEIEQAGTQVLIG
ncbi:MAG: cation:proton antiporter, partial [Melioribacteraceae bacterium]|nr:cation:proton antiporter [Melioribacteraceae bacterium]